MNWRKCLTGVWVFLSVLWVGFYTMMMSLDGWPSGALQIWTLYTFVPPAALAVLLLGLAWVLGGFRRPGRR